MFLRKIELQNIKCFETTGEISFMKTSRTPYKWITLLGENGVGKSTILQTIGLLLAGPEASNELLSRPDGWVRNSAKLGQITAQIQQTENDEGQFGTKRKTENFTYSYWVTGNTKIRMPDQEDPKNPEEKVYYTEPTILEEKASQRRISWLRSNAFTSNSKGWFAAGYGAFRRLTRERRILLPSMAPPTRSSNFTTLFNDDEPIESFERWMVYLDFRIAKNPNDTQAKKWREVGQTAVEKFLPQGAKIEAVTEEGQVLFNLNGRIVSTVSLSDGYRSIIALAGDLIWRLMQTFPHLEDPTQADGVVLIDELGIHLHPTWQRRIATELRETFPDLQFIVATHSPFIAIGAGDDSLTLRFEFDDLSDQVSIEKIESIANYDVERVLRSEAFELVSTYSPEIEGKIEQYKQLRLKFPNLKPAEQKVFEKLSTLMQEIQPYQGYAEPGSLMDKVNQFLEQNLP